LADIDDLGLERGVRFGVAECGDAQSARRGQRGEQRDLVVAAHPAGHGELLLLGLEAERAEFADEGVHRSFAGRTAGEAAAEVIAETAEQIVAGAVGEERRDDG